MRLRARFPALFPALLVLAPCLGSCSFQGPARAPGAGTPPPAVSRAFRLGTPVDPALVAADDGLGFALMNGLRLAKPGANLVLSPVSIGLALDMTYAGAAGATRKAMAAALQLGAMAEPGPEQANAALQASLLPADPGAQLSVANSLWVRGDAALPSFLALNRTYYGAFVGDLDGGPSAVNAWAERRSQGQITAMLPADSDLRGVDLLLVNTLCFRGAWSFPFQPQWTAAGSFSRQDGVQVACALMRRTGIMAYAETPEYQAVRLGYGKGRFGMILVLPAPGISLEAVAGLDPARCRALVESMDDTLVRLALPKFNCASSLDLQGPLTALGMGPAFARGQADFSAMAKAPQAIQAVLHQARIAVDEQGTLAAAGTAVEMGPTAVFADPRPMVLDRPFLVAIIDRTTSAVLFLGQVGDPSAR